MEIIINNIKLNYNNKITILGLKIVLHIKERVYSVGATLMRLKAFKILNERIIIHFYKALVTPLLEYPIVLICISSTTNKLKLQAIQNIPLYVWHPNQFPPPLQYQQPTATC